MLRADTTPLPRRSVVDTRIYLLYAAIIALGEDFSKFRTDTVAALDELRDELAERREP
jgi:hypothetical protein